MFQDLLERHVKAQHATEEENRAFGETGGKERKDGRKMKARTSEWRKNEVIGNEERDK